MAAPVGGMTRAKILDLILQTLRSATDKEATKEDMHLLTDEDLARCLGEVLEKVESSNGQTTAASSSAGGRAQTEQGPGEAPGRGQETQGQGGSGRSQDALSATRSSQSEPSQGDADEDDDSA